MTDINSLDATAQADLVRKGEASPVELVDAAIERIEKLNPRLNAVIHPFFERAREQADSGSLPDGPFRGVPILFKDLFCAVEGDPYNEGMQYLKDVGYKARRTDELARRYLAAGFAYLGRTNTPELGLVPTTEPLAYGPTRNPWDTSRSTGGSSGGSAAAVASGMVPVAHANDGGGSIRIPASCCGLVGLKPSRGRCSQAPLTDPIGSPLVSELCVSRSVRDAAGVLDALHGAAAGDTVMAPPPLRPYVQELQADPGKLRVGILTANPLGTGEIHADCVNAAEATGRLLESLGHHVEVAHPKALASPELVEHFTTLWTANLPAVFASYEAETGRPVTAADVEPLTWALAEIGRATPAPALITALGVGHRYSHDVAAWWASGWDLLLTPTLAEPPVLLGTFDTPDEPLLGFMRAATYVPFTAPFNVTGQPAIQLPLHMNDAGLPIGVQLVAAFGREDVLLRVASQLEQALPWMERRPTLV